MKIKIFVYTISIYIFFKKYLTNNTKTSKNINLK